MKINDADFSHAVEAVRSGLLSERAASKRYKVSRATIQRYRKDEYQESLKGPPTVLSLEEENQIAKWVIDTSKKGFPITQTDLRHAVQNYLRMKGKSSSFTQNLPGYGWQKAFMSRHPEISVRLAENITRDRADVSVDQIRAWFDEVFPVQL